MSLLVFARGDGGGTETSLSGGLLLMFAFLSFCEFGTGRGIYFVASFVGNVFIVMSAPFFVLALSFVVVGTLSGGASGSSILLFSGIIR